MILALREFLAGILTLGTGLRAIQTELHRIADHLEAQNVRQKGFFTSYNDFAEDGSAVSYVDDEEMARREIEEREFSTKFPGMTSKPVPDGH